MCCLIYKFLLILTQKMQISFLKILPENALKFVSKKMRICVKNFAQLQKYIRKLVEEGQKPIVTGCDVVRYMKLAEEYWMIKYNKINEMM